MHELSIHDPICSHFWCWSSWGARGSCLLTNMHGPQFHAQMLAEKHVAMRNQMLATCTLAECIFGSFNGALINRVRTLYGKGLEVWEGLDNLFFYVEGKTWFLLAGLVPAKSNYWDLEWHRGGLNSNFWVLNTFSPLLQELTHETAQRLSDEDCDWVQALWKIFMSFSVRLFFIVFWLHC